MPECDEVVVFSEPQALPRFVVELGVDLPRPMPIIERLPAPPKPSAKSPPITHSSDRNACIQLPRSTGFSVSSFFSSLISPPDQVSSPDQISVPPAPVPPARTFIQDYAFGKEQWEKYFGEPPPPLDPGIQFPPRQYLFEEEPPLPPDIEQFLQRLCPFWPDKKIYQTHLLTLIPKTVNGNPLTLKLLEKLVKHPTQGQASQYYDCGNWFKMTLGAHGYDSVKDSYWALLTKELISDNSNEYAQKERLKECNRTAEVTYEVPRLLDTAISIFLEYVRTGKRLYARPRVTRCQESVMEGPTYVGDFTEDGLTITGLPCGATIGLAAICRITQSDPISRPAVVVTPKLSVSLSSVSSLVSIPPQVVSPSNLPEIAFGKELRAEYFGDVGEEPPLPPDIDKILQNPCPFWPGEKSRRDSFVDTHS